LDFELLLTRIREVLHESEPETKPLPPPLPCFQTVRRILLVDDDSPWRQMAIANLTQLGYEVVTTNTAEGAVSEAARIRPNVMILDSKLEKETGLSVLLLLLAAHPSVPLLLYAGLGLGEQGKSELMNLGVSQILQKRSMEELLSAVQVAQEQTRQRVEASEAIPETTQSEETVRFDSVLIVEDDATFSGVLRDYLESQSFFVTCVPNVTEALRHIASTDFDVILTDMVLSEHSGEEFYNQVERLKPEHCRRFIFMTGHEAEQRTDNFIRRSRALMLWKPFPLSDLMSATETVRRKDWLARVLARSRGVTATLRPEANSNGI
jgi:DNA-binding NtrC family response regulator